MTQSTLSIANESFPSTRADLNTALQACGSVQSGASAPGTTYAYQWWADTTNGVLKQRDSSNASWQIRATLSNAMTPSKSASFSVALGDMGKTFMVSAAGGAVTASLLAAATATAGFFFSIKRTDSTPSNAIIIDANASETLDGALTQNMMNQYDLQTWECDGSNWYRIDGSPFTMTNAEITIASATTTDLGTKLSNMLAISGTTTITGFGSTASILNPVYFVRFTGALILTYNSTSLILPGSASITTVAGDTATFEYLGSGNWRCLSYNPISGMPVVAGAGQLAGYRNSIINGDIRLWQRDASTNGSYALTTTMAYGGPDRFMAQMGTSASGSLGQNASVPTGFRWCCRVGRTNGSALINQIILAQVLITTNSIPLAGKQVTLSYYAKAGNNYSSASSAISVLLSTGTGTDQQGTGGPAGTWTGAANPINTSDTLTTSWQRFQHTVTLASTVTQIAAWWAFSPVGTAGADDNFYITGIQLEPGPTATPFEYRPVEAEMDICKFYYEKSFVTTTAPAQNSASLLGAVAVYLPTGATGTFGCSVPMRQKRTGPTITTYNPSAANANWRDTTNTADRTVTVGNIGDTSFQISGAAGAAGAVNRIHWAADAEI